MLGSEHEVAAAPHYLAGVDSMRRRRPALILAGLDHQDGDAALLLRFLRDNGIRIPLIALAGRGAGLYQHAILRLGAKAFLEYPVEPQRLTTAVRAALSASADGEESIPPLTDEEAGANLSDLETRLNREMKCFAGRNLVYLQSRIGVGTHVRPRVSLKCPLRKEFGLNVHVYYEFIRDVCCREPRQCEAVQAFEARQDR